MKSDHKTHVHRVVADWGTSNLRAWAISDDSGEIVGHVRSDKGMGKLRSDQFEQVLVDLIHPWLTMERVMPVTVCGMAGARQGWMEVPYHPVPCAPHDCMVMHVPVSDPRLSVSIIGGMSQADPPDVMRGEETQISGLIAKLPSFTGIACLPGTHTKWAEISNGVVQRFSSVITGEIFALLSTQSVLRHAMGDGWCDAAFDLAVEQALCDPVKVPALIFSIRAQALLTEMDRADGKSRLSGLLIGQELAAMRELWMGKPVAIVGSGEIASRYARALTIAGALPSMLDADSLTVSGLLQSARKG